MREAGVQFGDEGWPAYPLHGVGGDDESQSAGELRLLDNAECLSRIGDAHNIKKLPFEN
jgi:hypothetical protein